MTTDWKAMADSIRAMTPRQRVDRFRMLDAWFADNPHHRTVVTVDGPSGSTGTSLDRSDMINERQGLAFQIARDVVAISSDSKGT
jgi:hypothetical protein